MPHAVILDPSSEQILGDLVRSGRYGSETEAVSEALRLLGRREARLAGLRQAWKHGVDSGDYRPANELLDALEDRYAAPVLPET
ncbi:ribbon-helix-helix domain-containing protein [Methylobacterium sp. JK268]